MSSCHKLPTLGNNSPAVCDQNFSTSCGDSGIDGGDIEGEDTLDILNGDMVGVIVLGDIEGEDTLDTVHGFFKKELSSRNFCCDISGCGQDGDVVKDTVDDTFEAAVYDTDTPPCRIVATIMSACS